VKRQKPKVKLIVLKADETISKKLQANADRNTQGNLSAWLRLAGVNFKPKKTYIPDFY